MNRFLITGGAGFIGSNLTNKLADNKDNYVVVVDNLSTGNKDHLIDRPNLKIINSDVNELKEIAKVFDLHQFDYVYHYAAVVGVQRTLKNPIKVLQDIDGIKNILELSRMHKVKRVLYSSSSEVYGEPVEMPQHEVTTPLNSRLPYAVVKNVGESYLRSYKFQYGLDYTIFRFFNTYGPRQSQDFVISKFLNAALKGDDITVYGEGSQTRTFCFVNDNIDATIEALNNDIAVDQVINIGSNLEITVLDLARKVIEITESKSKIVHLPPLKEGDMTRRKPDITKMKKLLKRDFIPLDEGLKQLMNYINK